MHNLDHYQVKMSGSGDYCITGNFKGSIFTNRHILWAREYASICMYMQVWFFTSLIFTDCQLSKNWTSWKFPAIWQYYGRIWSHKYCGRITRGCHWQLYLDLSWVAISWCPSVSRASANADQEGGGATWLSHTLNISRRHALLSPPLSALICFSCPSSMSSWIPMSSHSLATLE